MKMFVNDSEIMRVNVNPDENANGDILFGVNQNIAQDLNGSIDNFKFYNRTLDFEEINLSFRNGTGRITNPNINQTDLQVWYSMDEGFGFNTTDRINLYQANLTNNANWSNLGLRGLLCNYTYQDLDGDLENRTMPPPIVKWYLDGQTLNSLFNNQLFVYTTDRNYKCCVQSYDNVFTTGGENFACNQQLNQGFIQAIFLGIGGFAIILIYLAVRLSKKHLIVAHLFNLVACFILWVFINMLRFYANESFINAFSMAYMIALIIFAFFILLEVLTSLIQSIKS
jgi:hypothetical protein